MKVLPQKNKLYDLEIPNDSDIDDNLLELNKITILNRNNKTIDEPMGIDLASLCIFNPSKNITLKIHNEEPMIIYGLFIDNILVLKYVTYD